MKRGEVWTVAGGASYGGKPRPAIIVQDDRFDATKSITVCGLTTTELDAPFGRIRISPTSANGLTHPSWAMVDKIFTVRRTQLGRRVGIVTPDEVLQLNHALMIFLGLGASAAARS